MLWWDEEGIVLSDLEPGHGLQSTGLNLFQSLGVYGLISKPPEAQKSLDIFQERAARQFFQGQRLNAARFSWSGFFQVTPN